MPKSKPVRKSKPKKYDPVAIRKQESRLGDKWHKAIQEALEWLDELDPEAIPERRDGDVNSELQSAVGLVGSCKDILELVQERLPE